MLWYVGDRQAVHFYPRGEEYFPTLTTIATVDVDGQPPLQRRVNIVLMSHEPSLHDLNCIAHAIREDPTLTDDCVLLVGLLQPVRVKDIRCSQRPQLHGILIHANKVHGHPLTSCLPEEAVQYGWHAYISHSDHTLVLSSSHDPKHSSPIALPPLSRLGLKVWKRLGHEKYAILGESEKPGGSMVPLLAEDV